MSDPGYQPIGAPEGFAAAVVFFALLAAGVLVAWGLFAALATRYAGAMP